MDEDARYDAVKAQYESKREDILQRIRDGKVSASMSGLEYYPAPWDDLPEQEVELITTFLTWRGTHHEAHDWMPVLRRRHPAFMPG